MALRTDPVFENLTLPISEREEDALVESILREGCRKPISVWQGIVLDGHKRLKICKMEGISFETQEIDCKTEDEAIIWVCRERTRNMDRNKQYYRYLMGKWYLCEVMINRSVKKPRVPSDGGYYERHGNRTSIMMGQRIGVHHSTLEKYGTYAAALDVLLRDEPELFRALMEEEVRLGQSATQDLAHMDEKSRKDEARKILRAANRHAKDRFEQEERKQIKEQPEIPRVPLSLGVKEMPAFNPDMELQGLTLTIQAWIAAIDRAQKRSDLTIVSKEAKENLQERLIMLREQIEITMRALENAEEDPEKETHT